MKTANKPEEIIIGLSGVKVAGILNVPEEARGLVLFAHGSGSSRFSPRNASVANVLAEAKIATLLLDLLTPEEEADRANVFDIGLLAKRLEEVTRWIEKDARLKDMPLGYFGASTGAGAALQAAAGDKKIKAVVSRGGRPDLAMSYLPEVSAPTLLIVGGNDEEVLKLNKAALAKLSGLKRLEIVPSATHLFEEPGALRQVAILARDWFSEYLIQAL